MVKSLWKPVLAAGVVLFVWGNISWVLLPWHNMTFRTFADEDAVARVVEGNTDGRGIYLYPGQHHQPGMSAEEQEAAEAAVMEKVRRGPFLFVSVLDGGRESMTGMMIVGFVVQLLAALVLTLIVVRCGETDYWQRVSLVVLVVLAGGILCLLPQWNWFGFATGYTVVMLLDLLVAGLLAGLVIARLAR